MSPDEIFRLREVADSAAAAPWKQSRLTLSRVDTPAGAISVNWSSNDGTMDALSEDTAAFIAACREAVPALFAYIEKLKANHISALGYIEQAAYDAGYRAAIKDAAKEVEKGDFMLFNSRLAKSAVAAIRALPPRGVS